VHEWLEQARDRIAAASGTDSAALDLAESDVDVLLDLARVAAHSSGDRTNAPLVCFLLGCALERNPDAALADLARAAASDAPQA
jgi:hypothetical protein